MSRRGTRWFRTACESRGLAAVPHWQKLIRSHFSGTVKPPFNNSARGEAGLSRDFIQGLPRPRLV